MPEPGKGRVYCPYTVACLRVNTVADNMSNTVLPNIINPQGTPNPYIETLAFINLNYARRAKKYPLHVIVFMLLLDKGMEFLNISGQDILGLNIHIKQAIPGAGKLLEYALFDPPASYGIAYNISFQEYNDAGDFLCGDGGFRWGGLGK